MLQKAETALVCLFLLKLITISAFETAKCEHENLTTALVNLDECLEEESDTDDICSPFKEAGDCVENHLKICFEDENIKMMKRNTLAALRKVTTFFLLNPSIQKLQGVHFSESEVDSLYSTCPDIPCKEYTESKEFTELWQFLALEGSVRTDNNCTFSEITDINVGMPTCLKKEKEIAKTWLTRQRSGSFQSRICSIKDKTIGKCMPKLFKSCFSEREKIYLNNRLSEGMKNYFKTLEEVFDLKSHGFTISSCPVSSDAKKINTTCTLLHIIVLTLISRYYMD